jgi:hypothetical protein
MTDARATAPGFDLRRHLNRRLAFGPGFLRYPARVRP